jgi:hypothetical protein
MITIFCDFLTKTVLWSNYDQSRNIFNKNAKFFTKNFGENILKIIAPVPDMWINKNSLIKANHWLDQKVRYVCIYTWTDCVDKFGRFPINPRQSQLKGRLKQRKVTESYVLITSSRSIPDPEVNHFITFFERGCPGWGANPGPLNIIYFLIFTTLPLSHSGSPEVNHLPA